VRKFLIGLLVVVAGLVAAFVFFRDGDVPRAVLEAKYGAPASEFVMLPDGTRVHFRERGAKTAPVLLLLHGSNASFLTWEPWSKTLSDQFHVIAVDLPGHGLTGAVPDADYSQDGMAIFVAEFADKLGLSNFALAGNSMGGGVAARFAEEYPARVNHLILVDAAGMPVKGGVRDSFVYHLARTPVANQVLLYFTPRKLVVDGLDNAIVRKSIVTPAMIDSYWDFARMEGTRAATLKRFTTRADHYVRKHASAITMPTLILWGEEDRLIPLASGHEWAKAVTGSKLIVYPATGHIPMEEVADQSAGDVRAFLNAPRN
jgi:pimeloyl-ACP methyl ester carboxylesterase